MNDARPQSIDRTTFLVGCALILVVAITLRVLGIDRSLWIDEAGSLDQAQAAHFWAQARNDVHPPLYFLILRGLLQLSSSFVFVRTFSVVCGVALVGITLFALRRERLVAWMAAWVFATWPGFVDHGKELRPYALWYLLLGTSLLLIGRRWRGDDSRARSWLLAAALGVAACIHLLTLPFIVALAPLLFWPARRQGLRAWAVALAPAVPAVVLSLVWKYAFISPPEASQEGWWMPPASVHQVLWSLNQVFAWSDIGWLYNWGQRTLPGAGSVLVTLATAAALVILFAAWLQRRVAPLTWAYAACAVCYLAVIWTYSLCFEPIVWHRTLLPLILPLGLSWAWGIASRPGLRGRLLGGGALLTYTLLALVHPVRTASVPFENLKGLAAETRAEFRSGDCLVLMRSMDFALHPYWHDLASAKPVLLNLASPRAGAQADWHRRLASLPADARVLLVVREDQYFTQHPDRFAALLAEVRASGRTVRERWRDGLYVLYLAAGENR